MIITCEKCDTRFNLDDSRIPADGVKVRCSRCKHAFFVQPGETSGASDEAAADDLARDALVGAPPGQTQTLENGDDRTQMLEHGSVDFSAPTREESEEESDWEFNEDPEDERSAAPVAPEAAPAPVPKLADAGLDLGADPELADSGLDLGADPELEPAHDPPVSDPDPAPALDAEVPREGPADSVSVADPMNEFLASETPTSEADSLSLDDLGSPEEWDLLGSDEEETPPEAAPEPPTAAPVAEPAPVEAEEDEIHFDAPPATVVEDLPLTPTSPRTIQTGMGAVAWGVLAILLGLAAWGSLVPESSVPAHAAATQLGDLRVDAVEAHVVENAFAGPLYVVSGQLHNPGRDPSLAGAWVQVQLLDAAGAVLEEPPVPLAAALSETSLRMDEPELLLARQGEDADVLARTLIAPGESIAVSALLPRLPEGARSFRLELGRQVSSAASPESPLPDSESSPNPE